MSENSPLRHQCGDSLTHADFRIRKVPSGYRVWQRVGSGWEALADVYPSRADARAATQSWLLT